MRNAFTLAIGALALVPAASLAQTEGETNPFDGIYVGGSVGMAVQPNDRGSTILFDRDLNGSFGDTVSTATGANAFAPGFCNGAATGTGNEACLRDKDGIEYYGRIGADTDLAGFVVGIVGEFGRPEIRDSVSAFSSTPARYTMTRSLDWTASIRGRIGFTPSPARTTLFYVTGGPTYGRVENSFSTSNTANSFTLGGKRDAWGYSAGGGVEQIIGGGFSVGLEYIYTDLQDDNARVRVGAGSAPATNPFLLAGAGGTDFRRSDDNFRWHSIRATASFRF